MNGPGSAGGVAGAPRLTATPGAARRGLPVRIASWSAAWWVAAGLTGCASVAPDAHPGDMLSGRLALQVQGQPERGFSADFELRGDARTGELLLSGPLGSVLARARWTPDEAVLQAGGSDTREPDLDALSRRAFGEALPLAALPDWLRGRPWPGAGWQPRPDGEAGFDQLGWRLTLADAANGRITAQRSEPPPMLTVRVRLLPR